MYSTENEENKVKYTNTVRNDEKRKIPNNKKKSFVSSKTMKITDKEKLSFLIKSNQKIRDNNSLVKSDYERTNNNKSLLLNYNKQESKDYNYSYNYLSHTNSPNTSKNKNLAKTPPWKVYLIMLELSR